MAAVDRQNVLLRGPSGVGKTTLAQNLGLYSQRNEKRSTVISTNLPFKQWGTVFAGAACVAALVDRFVQTATCSISRPIPGGRSRPTP